MNVSSRAAVSIANRENPGVFIAQFDKGKRGRFTLLLDYQGRLPVSALGLNAGEKGVIFAYDSDIDDNDIWMAFYSQADYERRMVQYSDAFDQVNIRHYAIDADLRDPGKALKLQARMDCESRVAGLAALTLTLNESLPQRDSIRLKKALRVKSAAWADGAPVDAVQEDWEGGLTLYLDRPVNEGQKFSVTLALEGDFLRNSDAFRDLYFPLSTGHWYPRHGYLNRSTFNVTFHHKKRSMVAGVGMRVREEPAPDNPGEMLTEWKIDQPVALVTFGLGPFERHADTVKVGNRPLPVEFYSLSGRVAVIKEDFIVAELGNCVQYFSALFGPYPYDRFGAMYRPASYGQGFPTMLLLPKADSSDRHTFSFIAHETSHQWWGNVVTWRSYRDQWLSEGFAEYSGILYTGLRDKSGAGAQKELIQELRTSLKDPPVTLTGVGKGRLVDMGPIILGRRLQSRETLGAYTSLVYNKGALVLRMLHFLFTDPATGDGRAFTEMMQDFVRRNQGSAATTDSFRQVANEHFVRTPLAQKYRIQDLNWFFRQWVYETHLPSYRLVYRIEPGEGNSAVLRGVVYQDNAPKEWVMPLPLVMKLGKGIARTTVVAAGPETPFAIKLPARPDHVELDPDYWVLSEKTTTQKQ